MVRWNETLAKLSVSGSLLPAMSDDEEAPCEDVGEGLERRIAIREADEEVDFWSDPELAGLHGLADIALA
jgi:hypothetical protein